jgi:hypothetical protein
MATQAKINGVLSQPGAFYGYAPLCIKIADSTNGFTAGTQSADGITASVEGGYDKVIRAIQTLGSTILISAQANGAISVVVDATTFNAGAGPTTAGAYGALKDAVVATGVADVGDLTVTTGTVFASTGAFTLA